jgi:hypothetical protein
MCMQSRAPPPQKQWCSRERGADLSGVRLIIHFGIHSFGVGLDEESWMAWICRINDCRVGCGINAAAVLAVLGCFAISGRLHAFFSQSSRSCAVRRTACFLSRPAAGYCLLTASASALISSVLASAWAKSSSPWRFVLSMVVAWVTVSTLPLSMRPWEPTTFPANAAHFSATMLWGAPFVLVPVAALVWPVKVGASRDVILLVSFVASLVALPASFLSGIYAACSLGDCL